MSSFSNSAANQPKTIKVPYIEGLEKMSDSDMDSTLREKGSAGRIDVLNWPEAFAYCPQTEFHIARCGEGIAVLFDVTGKDLRAVALEDNGRSWEDSCCEMFISADGKGYFNIETTCIGSVLIAFGEGRGNRVKLPAEEVAKVRRRSSLEHKVWELEGGEHSWSLCILVPYEVLGLNADKLPSSVKGNFYKCADLAATPHYVTWSPIGTDNPDFHRPEWFGTLEF